MTPQEAQAAYVAAEDKFDEHRDHCRDCVYSSRLKYPRYCPEAKRLSLIAFGRRQDWRAAVAAARKAAAS